MTVPLTMNDLTITPAGLDMKSILDDWKWLMTEPTQPVLITAIGDLFAEGKSGQIYFVDVVEGAIHELAECFDDFKTLLTDKEFVTGFMFPERIIDYREAGLTLGPNQVYGFKQPLPLGGKDEVENIEPTDVSVHVSLHGQIHRQIKQLPEGESVRIEMP